ncbi:MAG: transposase [Candidatus Marinimicrobia bacterium]|nr:transposase [Candidatus Neomarinimicrobiota bacterium]
MLGRTLLPERRNSWQKNKGNATPLILKFAVVLEVLTSTADAAEIARKHGVHPVTLSHWKTHLLDHGAKVEVFARTQQHGTHQQDIARLEQMLSRKEGELALAKYF